MSPRLLAALCVVAAVAAVAGCSTGLGTPDDGKIHVTTSFYPLQHVAERVGGDQVDVTSLTKPGAEPHDLELTPRDVAGLQDADLVLYVHGFQPAVDEAVTSAGPKDVLDAAPAAHLDLTFTPIEEGEQHADEAGAVDPHFWLDPTRLSAVAAAFEQRLAQLRPASAPAFARNLAGLQAELSDLDTSYREGLAHCADLDLVTSHNAFGYLARRYGLHQVGITGLTPEAEPGPRQLADVATFVREHGTRTIYYETLVSPAVARTVAAETGARTAVLDPLEGLSDASAGSTYGEVMRSNLATLRAGQGCR
ncbi:zinc ABC transporter substrate-binding protein [Angustibacter peucedani]